MACFAKIIIVSAVSWFALAAAGDPASTAAAEEKQTARVLIVTGQDYPGHKWRLTTPVLADLLKKDRRLDVRVVEDPHFLDSPALQRYDAVVLHFMNWEQPAPGPIARANLRQFVAGGKGLVLVHFACGAFQDWPEFHKLAGRVWDPKKRGHDPHGTFRVNISDFDHPVTRGMRSFETTDELYTCLASDKKVDILATARSSVDAKDYPMAFAFSYGQGRVFHSPLGHDVKAISNPMVAELFRRGCAWAAGLNLEPAATTARPTKDTHSHAK
jgi:type 1 glutamine amidotransferase